MLSKLLTISISCALPLAAAVGAEKSAPAEAAVKFDAGTVSGLGARNIGSAAMSGRIAAIAARHEDDGRTTLFVGAASGGVWKSLDDGTTFKPVFDKQGVQSIGAIALDPNDAKTIWVGSGESWTRNSTSVGDGIYKSTDGGDTWTNMGLPNSERIVKIAVDPKNSATVYACVPGKLWSDSADRGLYKTTDGGKSWTLALKGGNLSTGCASLSMDPQNPQVLFASLWDFRRKGWTFRSGGEDATKPSGSGLFKSTDGGKSWTEVAEKSNKGFPAKPYGRITVAMAPSNTKIVYAIVESEHSSLYRSDDGGATWDKRDNSQMMVWRPFYFGNLIVDPTNPERLFKPDLALIQSLDGGHSFANVGGGAHGDFHDVWIDPKNPAHVIAGDDGGIWYSHDGGNQWWKGNNLPVSQFYHVSLDNADPYHVYGGLQDNSSWVGDSAYPGGITNSRWENMYGGDGFWMFADPADDHYIYAEAQGGTIGRVNRYTHEIRNIQPTARYKEKLRWNWNTPIALSPNEKGTIYIGSQFLFRTRDHGQSWERISPDLTTNDPLKQKQEESGGVTIDNSAAEMHTTIYSISESPKNGKTIWVGTDDGNVQLTRDGGDHWSNVVGNVKGLPKNSWVNWVQASNFDEGTAYAAFDRHTYGDLAPYVYRTTDFGKTWTRIIAPEQGVRGYAYVIKEDTKKPDLLFAGTEFGLWISADGGKQWAQFKGGHFPSVSVRDLAIQDRDSDLVVATHGRGMWIIDDITPLRELAPQVLASDAVFLKARPQMQRMRAQGGWSEGDAAFSGTNPPNGAVITYYQRSRHLFGKIKLEILDADGKLVDTLPASERRGLNRIEWSMQVKPPRVPRAAQLAFNGTQGPRVLPGTYTVRLTKGDKTYEEKLDVGLDRRATFSVADRKAQFDAAMKVHAMFGDESDLVYKINAVREGAKARADKLEANDALRKELTAVGDKADALRKRIVATKEGGAITGEQRLREFTDDLYGAVMSYEGKPGDYLIERTAALRHELDDVAADFAAFEKNDVAKLNAALKAKNVEPIEVPAGAPPVADLGNAREDMHRHVELPFEQD
jgi:photosystem II stability/assembly factor-like uncharacterized protein